MSVEINRKSIFLTQFIQKDRFGIGISAGSKSVFAKNADHKDFSIWYKLGKFAVRISSKNFNQYHMVNEF